MQIKMTIRHHFTPVRMAIIKRQQITSAGEDMEGRESLCTAGGNINKCSHYGKQYGDFTKVLK